MINRWWRLQFAWLLLCIGVLPCWAESESVSLWKQQIVAQLQAHRHFPIEACGKDGEARVAFSIDRTGKLLSSDIVSGAGFPALDKAALEMVRSAQPFPPAPSEVADDGLKFVVPLIFAKANRAIPCEAIRSEEKLRSVINSSDDKLRSVINSICRGC
jgi:protein TonB